MNESFSRRARYCAGAEGLVLSLVLIGMHGSVAHGAEPGEVAAAFSECTALSYGAPSLTLGRKWRGKWSRGGGPDEYVSLWLEDGAIRVATLATGSDDNAIYVRYCFRSSGTLAFIHTSLGTVYTEVTPSPARIERRLYFNPKGHLLRTRVLVYDANRKRVDSREQGNAWLEFERHFATEKALRAFFAVPAALFEVE